MKISKIIAVTLAALFCLTAFAACKKDETDTQESADVYYTVTFNSAGGGDIEPKRVKKGTAVNEPIPPERDGYIFDGWYNGTSHWDFASYVKDDMTLTAHWVEADTFFSHTPRDDGETTAITGIKKKSEVIQLPTYIGGYRVTAIGEGVFSNLSLDEVTKIVIPEGISVIENNAFSGSAGIEIVIKGEISFVGEKAFLGCTGLEDIKLGGGIEAISAEAFAGTGLKSVALPESIKTVDENAFFECEALKTLFLYGDIELIGDMAFRYSAIESLLFYGSYEELCELTERKISSHNDVILDAKKYIYSETEPAATVPEGCDGYWYFNEKGQTRLWKMS